MLERMRPQDTVDTEAAYREFRPFLFAALGKLAEQGYTVPPDEAMDVIHDFFLDEWPNVTRRFTPTKGSTIRSYTYLCFVSFARRRISRLVRLKGALLGPMDLAGVVDEEHIRSSGTRDAENVLHRRIDASKIQRAIEELPILERSVLWDYVSVSELSERRLADKYAISRHRLREVLVNAFGRLAAEIGPLSSSQSDGTVRIIEAVWRDQRSIGEVADMLHVSAKEIKSAKTWLLKVLSSAMKGEKMAKRRAKDLRLNEAPPVSATSYASESLPAEFMQQLAAWLSGAIDVDLVPQIREFSHAIVEYLAVNDDFGLASESSIDTKRLSMFYTALAGEVDRSTVEDDTAQALLGLRSLEDEAIGMVFRDVLIPALSDSVADIEHRFRAVEYIGDDAYDALKQEHSVISGGPKAVQLARFGITPVTLVVACRSISKYLRRYHRQCALPKNSNLILERAKREEVLEGHVISRDELIGEIGLSTALPPATAARLYDWLIRMSEYSHYIFDGFYTRLLGDRLIATRSNTDGWTVAQLWAPEPPYQVTA